MRGMQSVLLAAIVIVCAIMVGCAAKAPANGPGPLVVAQFTLAQGAINVPYRQLLVANGGVQPYTWSISSGSLPPGLTVTSDGIISGMPTTTGTYYFAAQVVDSQRPIQAIDTAPESITINQDLSLTASPLGTATVGQAYNATFMAANGVPPYSYVVTTGVPCDGNPQQMCPAPGLTLTTVQPQNGMANAAAVMGTPTTAGIFSFTVQATDGASETATAVFTVQIVGRLQGPYMIYFNGFDTSQPAGSQAFNLVAQIVAANDMNGSGTITGVLDQNGASATAAGGTTVTGTYIFPLTSNFGVISFTRADGVGYQFNVALSGTSSDSSMIQYDANNMKWGSGLLKKQSQTTLSGGSTYTYGLFGTDTGGGRYAGAGAFALNGSLAVTGGAQDINDAGTLSGEKFIGGGSFTTPDGGTGRGTATLMVGSNSVDYVYYVVSNTELVAISSDSGAPNTLVDIVQQQSAGISGGFVLCKSGGMCQSVLELTGTTTSGSNQVPEAEVGVASFDGSGNFTRGDSLPPYYVDQAVNGTLSSLSYAGGTYSIDPTCGPNFPNPCGRVTLNLQGPANQPVWYLITTSQAFVVGGDADVLQGTLQPQAPPSAGFGLLNLLGSYLGGSITPALPSVTNEIDVAGTPPPGGVWNQNYDTSGPMGYMPTLSFMGTYNIDNIDPSGTCNNGANCLGPSFGRFAVCAPMTTEYCTSFVFDPSNPPASILYITGGASAGATGGKTGLVGINLGTVQSNGTATIDMNPRLSVYGR